MSLPIFLPRPLFLLLSIGALAGAAGYLAAQAPEGAELADSPQFQARLGNVSRMAEAALAEPFVGITTDGEPVPGLFPIVSTGVPTTPIREAATRYLDALDPAQRDASVFPVDDEEWRRWANQSIYDSLRQGIPLEAMTEEQREAALGLLRASLSAKGLQLAQDIMRLNHHLGELQGGNFFEYGDQKYWLTFMGEPSADEPWGWQLDGHHLNLNYFVMGDQVVMTPAFWGSEPVVAESGRYAGTRILREEQEAGLALLRALDEDQRAQAVIKSEKTGNDILSEAFSDNVRIGYAGIRAADLDEAQRARLVNLIRLYVGNLREGHAEVRMEEVVARLDETWFAWVGGMAEDSVFYYRIHSPVILIEFDHQSPVGLTHLYPRGVPYQEHVHTVVRTPNGNDYGKDLLRQHYERHPHR